MSVNTLAICINQPSASGMLKHVCKLETREPSGWNGISCLIFPLSILLCCLSPPFIVLDYRICALLYLLISANYVK